MTFKKVSGYKDVRGRFIVLCKFDANSELPSTYAEQLVSNHLIVCNIMIL